MKSCFGKLGSTGNSEECKSSVGYVISELDGQENYCFITADEIYVKAAVRYRAGHIISNCTRFYDKLPVWYSFIHSLSCTSNYFEIRIFDGTINDVTADNS